MEEIDKIIADLGANYKEEDKEVLKEILEEVDSIAFDISNNKNKEQLFPYVKRAVKSIYLTRGGEGLQNQNVGSISYSYEDIIDKLRNDIIKAGLRRFR